MKKYFIVPLSFLVLTAQAQKKPVAAAKPKASALKNFNDSMNYAIGVSVANYYNGQDFKQLNPALIAKAIADVNNKKAVMKDDDVNKCMMQFISKRQEVEMKEQSIKAKPTIEAGEKFLAENAKKAGVKTTASGLQYEVVTEGTGPKPKATDTVTVNYVGTLVNGTEFDNSYKRGQSISFPLNGVIKGWTEGVQLMPVGSKYKFYIPYQLGYGLQNAGPIPPGSVLIFEIELLGIKGK
ncbi:MAG: peptidylprolyl isomerase [Chitinophagaceae bacterium]